jgi:uncharacterized protein
MAQQPLKLLLGSALLALPLLTQAGPATCQVSFSSGARMELPIARTWQEQQTGLSGRLDAGPGLLFLWTEPVVRTLWMKSTYIPLSAAFIDASGLVLNIVDMEPGSEEHHSSPAPALAAIELAQGEFSRSGIRVGDKAAITCAAATP